MSKLTPVEVFEAVGKALCPGDSWKADLADLMGVRRDTIRNWLNGRMTLRPNHFASLLMILVERKNTIADAERELKAWFSEEVGKHENGNSDEKRPQHEEG